MDRKLSGVRADIIGYQLAERIKSGLIIGFKVISAAEVLEGDELKGAKKAILAYLDALSAETGIALNATRLEEFSQVNEKIADCLLYTSPSPRDRG